MWVLIENKKEGSTLEWIECSCLTFDGRGLCMTAWNGKKSIIIFSLWNLFRIQDSAPEGDY